MKAALFLCVAGAFAAAPPRIELDLASWDNRPLHNGAPHGHLFKPENSPVSHGSTPADAGARHDWSARCPAGTATTINTCPFPVAKAWDHQDKDISNRIVTRVFLLNEEGVKQKTAVTRVNFASRAKYIFLYDVTDTAGNRAEQVVYMLELDDTTRPDIRVCGGHAYGKADVWEAAEGGEMCRDTTVNDNIDGSNMDLFYRIVDVANGNSVPSGCSGGAAKYNVNDDGTFGSQTQNWHRYSEYLSDQAGTSCAAKALKNDHGPGNSVGVGEFLIYFRVCDKAGEYAQFAGLQPGHKNNCRMVEKALKIQDTQKPWITIHGDNPRNKQCYKNGVNTVNDLDTGATIKYDDNIDGAPAATVHDKLDTETEGQVLAFQTTPGKNANYGVDETTLGSYYVHYNAKDDSNNNALQVTREVRVVDTISPTITLKKAGPVTFVNDDCGSDAHKSITGAEGEHPHTCVNGHANTQGDDYAVIEPGWTCADDCDTNPTKHPVTWNQPLDVTHTGTYQATYKCTDASNNEHIVTRDFIVEDKGKPIIRVTGEFHMTIEATLAYTYVDDGAVCTDTVDGILSNGVVVGGDNVDIGVNGPVTTGSVAKKHGLGAGNYVIQYDCSDLSNNAAVTQYRTVTVQDTTCPALKLNGAEEVTIEAGFKYNDAGATAQDNLNEDISGDVKTRGNTVNTLQTTHVGSCAEIKEANPNAASGDYYIIRQVHGKLERVEVTCDMSQTKGFTYKMISGGKAVVPYTEAQGDCPAWGLEMIQWTATNDANKLWMKVDTQLRRFITHPEKSLTDMYLCGINTETKSLTSHPYRLSAPATAEEKKDKWANTEAGSAQVGVYVITYWVHDAAGNRNDECAAQCQHCCGKLATGSQVSPGAICGNGDVTIRRTVTVQDTLPPVISLHLKRGNNFRRVQVSDASATGVNGQANPAGTNANPFLVDPHPQIAERPTTLNNFMTEQSTSLNGWIAGAIVSGAAGLAMLAASFRKAPVTVEV